MRHRVMAAPPLRQANVVYLMRLTATSSSGCSVVLLIWLTATSSFPTCCWSITPSRNRSANAHHQTETIDPHAAHREHHEAPALREAGPSQSATFTNATSDCAAARQVAAVRAGTSPTLTGSQASGPAAMFVVDSEGAGRGALRPE